VSCSLLAVSSFAAVGRCKGRDSGEKKKLIFVEGGLDVYVLYLLLYLDLDRFCEVSSSLLAASSFAAVGRWVGKGVSLGCWRAICVYTVYFFTPL